MRSAKWMTVLAFVVGGACSSPERPPTLGSRSGTGGTGPVDGGLVVDAGDGQTGVCGEEVIPAVVDPPTLYFVLDRSGSMNDSYGDSGDSKYQTARDALGEVLRAIGHRVRYGAAVFPAIAGSDGCAPGRQVFPTTMGDPPTYAAAGQAGPVLADFLTRLGYAEQEGGTPTSATLTALEPTLIELGPRTYVVLATDGAPNCNALASCDAESCMPNIEGASYGATACDADFNCCDPANTGEGAGSLCVDDLALEDAVQSLADLGIPTYVVGLPGADFYADLLGRVAEIGGTARDAEPAYYAAADAEALTDALYEIGTGVAISCSIELKTPPLDPDLVNVYYDGRLVLSDPEDGWTWTGEQALEVRGAACEELESGAVYEAQVVYGCATEVR